MNIWHLVTREIRFRPLNFSLGVLAVAIAVACLVGSLTLLRIFDRHTERITADNKRILNEQMQDLERDYRKITLNLGFNLLILPRDQQLGDFYANDFAAKMMPQNYADRLAGAGVMTIQHLLPVLQQKIEWPERKRTILLTGTEGEVSVPDTGKGEGGGEQEAKGEAGEGGKGQDEQAEPGKGEGGGQQEAKGDSREGEEGEGEGGKGEGAHGEGHLLEMIPPDGIALGYELYRSLGLSVGDKVRLFGQDFTVGRCNPERGNKDDITAWIDLPTAQHLLKQEGKINAIFALTCECQGQWARLATIRSDVANILPQTQVIEFASQAVTRAEARQRSEDAARQALANEESHRAGLRAEREHMIKILVPVALAGCIVWIGLLAFGNVHDRRSEIGILRAFGVTNTRVQMLFLLRSALMGFVGALLGSSVGFAIGILSGRAGGAGSTWAFDPNLFLATLILVPLLCAIAGWVPAMAAVRQDPADVLGEE